MRKFIPRGSVVEMIQGVKLTAFEDGKLQIGKWVHIPTKGIGRIIDIKDEGKGNPNALRGRQTTYIVNFATGIAVVGERFLRRVADVDEHALDRDQMEISDPDLRVTVTPLENEPQY